MNHVALALSSGSYSVGGGHINLLYTAQYAITDLNEYPNIVNIGDINQQGEPFDIVINHNGIKQPIPSAVVMAYVDNVAVDIDTTDINGSSFLFLSSGTYDIEIHSSLLNRTFHDYEVTNTITPVYSYIEEGNSINQYHDVTEYPTASGSVYQINGTVIDEEQNIFPGAEILITQDENIVVDYITDDCGKYLFLLPTGTFDIRLRAKDKAVKKYNGFTFNPTSGFLPVLASDDVNFNVGGDWLWIFN